MRPDEIRAHHHKQPFQPIRVFVSDGSYYDVRHPELMMVSRAEIVIGLEPDKRIMPERNAYIDPVHVTRIEPINGAGPTRRRGSGNKK